MALTREQIVMVKRAQREAGIGDEEYRATLESLTGCTSSKDARLSNRQFDVILAYFEAIAWRGRDRGELPAPGRTGVFLRRGYWAGKNTAAQNSRDRYVRHEFQGDIKALEERLQGLGCSPSYLGAIRTKTRTVTAYRAALTRTLRSREETAVPADNIPF